MTDDGTKASSCGGKVHDKDKGIIAQSAQHNRNVLINERSIKDRGNIGVVKGHQMIVTIEIEIIPKKG